MAALAPSDPQTCYSALASHSRFAPNPVIQAPWPTLPKRTFLYAALSAGSNRSLENTTTG